MRTRRDWRRSSWNRPIGDEKMRLRAVLAHLDEWAQSADDDGNVTIPAAELAEARKFAAPKPGLEGADIQDAERGVRYRVTLDTTKPREPRLHSVEIIREVVEPGIKGYTMKGGPLRRKGKVGSYLAPYDEGIFRVPVKDLIAQASAVIDRTDGRIVIAPRTLAPPTPEDLRYLIEHKTVSQIADRYERTARTVYDWLAAAREATPELNWPEVKHGPAKKTTGDD